MSDKNIIVSFDSDERLKQKSMRPYPTVDYSNQHTRISSKPFNKTYERSNDCHIEADQVDRTMDNHHDFDMFNVKKRKTVKSKQYAPNDIKRNGDATKMNQKPRLYSFLSKKSILGLTILLIAFCFVCVIGILLGIIIFKRGSKHSTNHKEKLSISVEKKVNMENNQENVKKDTKQPIIINDSE